MKPAKPKVAYTTGEVADMLGVSAQAVIKWVDSGKLGGYKIPFSRSRRIPRKSLQRFLETHRLGLLEHGAGPDRPFTVAVISEDPELVRRVEREAEAARKPLVRVAGDALRAGAMLTEARPEIILLDERMPAIEERDLISFVDEEPGFFSSRVYRVEGNRLCRPLRTPDSSRAPCDIKQVLEVAAQSSRAAPVSGGGEKDLGGAEEGDERP